LGKAGAPVLGQAIKLCGPGVCARSAKDVPSLGLVGQQGGTGGAASGRLPSIGPQGHPWGLGRMAGLAPISSGGLLPGQVVACWYA
jgi:hypothetical protein